MLLLLTILCAIVCFEAATATTTTTAAADATTTTTTTCKCYLGTATHLSDTLSRVLIKHLDSIVGPIGDVDEVLSLVQGN